MAIRHAGDLEMGDMRDIGADFHRHVAFDDLAVIEVHLQRRIHRADRLQHRDRVVLTIEIEARNIAAIDRFQQDSDAMRGKLFGGVLDIADKGGAARRHWGILGLDASHDMQTFAAEYPGIVQRLIDKSLERRFATRYGG